MEFDVKGMGEVDNVIPLNMRHRRRWIASLETVDELRRQFSPTIAPPDLAQVVGMDATVTRLWGFPVRVVPGFEGLALEIIGAVKT